MTEHYYTLSGDVYHLLEKAYIIEPNDLRINHAFYTYTRVLGWYSISDHLRPGSHIFGVNMPFRFKLYGKHARHLK